MIIIDSRNFLEYANVIEGVLVFDQITEDVSIAPRFLGCDNGLSGSRNLTIVSIDLRALNLVKIGERFLYNDTEITEVLFADNCPLKEIGADFMVGFKGAQLDLRNLTQVNRIDRGFLVDSWPCKVRLPTHWPVKQIATGLAQGYQQDQLDLSVSVFVDGNWRKDLGKYPLYGIFQHIDCNIHLFNVIYRLSRGCDDVVDHDGLVPFDHAMRYGNLDSSIRPKLTIKMACHQSS